MSFARVRALVVVGVLAVAAMVFVVVALVRDSQGDSVASGCPEGAPLVNLTLPDKPEQVKVRILNGTGTAGLADKVSTDFENRGFTMQKTAESKTKFDRIATITYGPKMVGSAQLIKAYFLGKAKPLYDPKRTSDVIDIVVGAEYQQLATSTEVNQSLIELGEPELPPGSCEAPAQKS